VKTLLWLLALFVLAVVVSLTTRFNEAYLLFVFPSYRAEITLNLALILGTAAFALLYALLRTLTLTASLPRQARDYRQRRQREDAAACLALAVQCHYAGRYRQALRQAGQAYSLGGSASAALLAARAAFHLADLPQTQHWLSQITPGNSQARVAGELLAVEMAIAQRQYAAAIAILQRLRTDSGLHLAALRLQLRAESGRGNWSQALRLARRLQRHRLLPASTVSALEKRAAQNLPAPDDSSPPLDATFFL
jgi:HemY protein